MWPCCTTSSRSTDQLTIATLTPVSGTGFRLTAFRNMLLVLLRKDTGVVDEVAYRQEFAR